MEGREIEGKKKKEWEEEVKEKKREKREKEERKKGDIEKFRSMLTVHALWSYGSLIYSGRSI